MQQNNEKHSVTRKLAHEKSIQIGISNGIVRVSNQVYEAPSERFSDFWTFKFPTVIKTLSLQKKK